MKKIPKAIYQTPEQLYEVIAAKEVEARALPAGAQQQALLIEISKLRAYASMKRWASSGQKNDGRK